MIVNLERFIANERPHWERLDGLLRARERDPFAALSLEEAREFERLYQRASADLARLATFTAEPAARAYLEGIVARAFAEVHGSGARRSRVQPLVWLGRTLPRTFRRRIHAFWLALALTVVGATFGALALAFDPEAKAVIMPFEHLQGDPAQRVAEEEKAQRSDRLEGRKAGFAGHLMVHNTRVTLTAMALGLSWGVGTLLLIFYNGVILGAVVIDYVLAGQTTFLAGWLLPHGAVEIPAILIGGQAGFVLAGALLGRGSRATLRERLRAVVADVVTLAAGAALLLVWAGFVESFLSQYHEPVVPYWAKIVFGLLESAALWWWFGRLGRAEPPEVRA